MKRRILLSGVILALLLLFSCQNEEKSQEGMLLQNLSFTTCTNNVKSVLFDNEYAECSFVDAQTMHVNIYNLDLNCGITNIKGIANLEGISLITVQLETTGKSANCICERNISFDIKGVLAGEDYTVNLNDYSISFNITFKEDMGIVKINRLNNQNN